MAEIEFRELRGDYVANAGQTISLREYLDYFEPLGSSLSRLPDGVGGPFVHQFVDGGGRTIGSMGWVVSAASKRFGAWTLWGMWTDRAIPAVALPLYWSMLSDPARVSELVRRANDDAERLADRRHWAELMDDVKTLRLRDDLLRESLKGELAHAWSVPPPYRHSIEVELRPDLLDLLPWLYILGPVDPVAAQLQPSRFNDAGYQYILDHERAGARGGASSSVDVGELVDVAASDVVAGWRMANELRARRGRPKRADRAVARPQPAETNEMQTETSSTRGTAARKPPIANTARLLFDDAARVLKPVYAIAVIALLAWIAVNVHLIRKTLREQSPAAPAVSETIEPVTTGTAPAAAVAEDPSRNRVPRIAAALAARPVRGIRVNAPVLDEIARGGSDAPEQLARVAIEVFLRRNGCYARTEAADGRLSTNETRAARNCAVLQDQRLMNGSAPDTERAIAWLERTIAPE
jgi:hypothetical protein